jgi:hypothetical protein
MICPACGTENKPGAAFCGKCGTKLADPGAQTQPAAAVPPQAPGPAPAATQPMPAAPVYAPPPQQPVYAPPPPGVGYGPGAPVPPGGPVPPGAVGPPPKKGGAGAIFGIIAIIVVLLACCIGGYFGWQAWSKSRNATGGSTATTGTATPTTKPTATGFATAEAALQDTLTQKNASDWVYKVVEQSKGRLLYWIGPPNSEYTDQVIVTQNPDGTWTVQGVEALGGETTGGTSDTAAAAVDTVNKFLTYVKKDDGMKAHSLTIEPFASDGASAQVSNGDLMSWEILNATQSSDGSVKVEALEHWKSAGDVDSTYTVVMTGEGPRISELSVK